MEKFEAYICTECDTDFGINEFGIDVREGTHILKCPVCGCRKFRIYLIATKDPLKDRPTKI